MRRKNAMIIGFMAMMAMTGLVNGPSSFALEAAPVMGMDRMGHGGSTYSSSQPDGATACLAPRAERRKVDVVERIGTGGSTYVFSKADGCETAGEGRNKVEIIKRIGTGGSIYSSGQPMS